MSEKTKRIISNVLMVLPSIMILMSGIMKLIGAQQVVDNMSKAGLASYISILGVVELISVALFLYPKTYKIGFLLLCCYLGGALSIELSAGQPPMAAVLLTVLWISVYLRDRFNFVVPVKVKSK
ncbi:MAG: hypothetical protein K0S32_3504 [Bacteroidetes bacterium]|jgi:hypothetical protein|nr:hypothetical protein [Bacteroidota bacterium]